MLRGRIVDIVGAVALVTLLLLDWKLSLPTWVYMAVVAGYFATIGLGSAIISSQFFIHVLYRGAVTSGAIAITFDDGPVNGKTDRILDILKEYNAAAAFFCIGNRAEQNPDLVRRIHAEGHLVGNHSYHHGKLFDLQSATKMSDELNRTDKVIEHVIGKKPRFFRPPFGVTNPMLARAVKEGNYATIGWNVRSMDTVIKQKDKLLLRVISNLKAGDVVLFHDYAGTTIEVLPAFLEAVSKKGLKIARVDTLLNEIPYA